MACVPQQVRFYVCMCVYGQAELQPVRDYMLIVFWLLNFLFFACLHHAGRLID